MQSIESKVLSSFAAEEAAAPEDAPVPPEEENAAEDVPSAEHPARHTHEAPEEDAERALDEDLAATRRIDFGDLKFGRNYKRNT